MSKQKKGKLKVLLVEDEEMVREVVEAMIPYAFQDFDFEVLEVVTASSSEAAFAAIDAARETGSFNFVLSDIQCDARNDEQKGFEVVRVTKEAMPDCVAFVMSGGAFATEEKILAKALSVGAATYIKKPIEISALAAQIKKYFRI